MNSIYNSVVAFFTPAAQSRKRPREISFDDELERTRPGARTAPKRQRTMQGASNGVDTSLYGSFVSSPIGRLGQSVVKNIKSAFFPMPAEDESETDYDELDGDEENVSNQGEYVRDGALSDHDHGGAEARKARAYVLSPEQTAPPRKTVDIRQHIDFVDEFSTRDTSMIGDDARAAAVRDEQRWSPPQQPLPPVPRATRAIDDDTERATSLEAHFDAVSIQTRTDASAAVPRLYPNLDASVPSSLVPPPQSKRDLYHSADTHSRHTLKAPRTHGPRVGILKRRQRARDEAAFEDRLRAHALVSTASSRDGLETRSSTKFVSSNSSVGVGGASHHAAFTSIPPTVSTLHDSAAFQAPRARPRRPAMIDLTVPQRRRTPPRTTTIAKPSVANVAAKQRSPSYEDYARLVGDDYEKLTVLRMEQVRKLRDRQQLLESDEKVVDERIDVVLTRAERQQLEAAATKKDLLYLEKLDEEMREQHERKERERAEKAEAERLADEMQLSEAMRARELFPPLSAADEALVERAFNAPPDTLLSEVDGTPVTANDAQGLRDGRWLNDEVINAYLNILRKRAEADPSTYYDVHWFNTFFFALLTNKMAGYEYSRVRKWTKKFDLFKKDKVFCGVHLGSHWCLGVINFKEKRLEYYDSLGHVNPLFMDVMRKYLRDEMKNKKKKDFDFTGWTEYSPRDIPQQRNGYDCGVFMCQYARFAMYRNAPLVNGTHPFSFTQKEMPYFRKLMLLTLIQNSDEETHF